MKKISSFILCILFVLDMFNAPTACYGMEEPQDIELQRKIGQLLIVGFQGTLPEDEGPTKICRLLKEEKLGGVILYRYNIVDPNQLLRLTQSFYDANPKAFIAVDQEGGQVQRLTSQKGFNITTPSAQKVAEQCSEYEQSRVIYNLMAQELANYRINVNFGPVVDLNNPEHPSPAIGKYERSYSNNPDVVTNFARIFIEEHRMLKILTSPKHWPGHGYSTADSHQGLTDTTKTAVPERELLPYTNLISSGHVDMLMTAHVVNTNYDPEGYPATLSPKTLKNLLRSLGYNGVVISDDLHMGAIQQHYPFETAIMLAVNATCDMLIFSNNAAAAQGISDFKPDASLAEKVIDTIYKKITLGQITLERIEESYQRVTLLKNRLS